MNKIIAVLALFSFLLGAAPVYAEWEPVSYAEREYACGLLAAMGAVQADQNGQVDQTVPVTRGELADAVLHLSGAYDSALYASVFDDVAEDTPYAPAICRLAQMGVIDGVNVENYRPEETATYVQGVKMLISLLGYDKFAEMRAGYPMGYLQTAAEIGLTKNIQAQVDYPMDRGLLAALLFNALDCKMAETDYMGRYYPGDESLLQKLLDMDKVQGIMTDNGITGLVDKSETTPGMVTIGDVHCYDAAGVSQALLGYTVVGYYKTDGGENHMVYAYKTTKNAVITVDARDIDREQVSLEEFHYYDQQGKSQRVSIEEEADVIYNGVADPAFTAGTLRPENGTVCSLDNDGDGAAEVILVEELENYVVSVINAQDMTVYDKYGKTLDMAETKTIAIKGMYGDTMSFSQLKEWDVLCVAASRDMEYVQITVVNDPVTGMIEGMYQEDGYTYITVDGESFPIAKSYEEALAAGQANARALDIGQSGTYYLDSMECVAAVVPDVDIMWTYGYLITARLTEEEQVRIKVLKDVYGAKMYDLADKVRIDGVRFDEAECYRELCRMDDGALCEEPVPRLVKFRLDGAGYVVGIDTARQGSGETQENLQLDMPKTKEYWSVRTGRFGTGESVGVMVAPSTKVFKVPVTDVDNEEKYAVSYSFRHNYEYTYEAFDVDFSGTAGALVVYIDDVDEETQYESALLVDEVTTQLTADDEIVTVLRGYSYDGTFREYPAEDASDLAGIDYGDIVTYQLNYRNELYNIEMQYDFSENDGYTTTAQIFHSTGDYTAAYESNAQTYLTRNIILEKQGGYIQSLIPGMDFTALKKNELTFREKQIYSTADATIFLLNKNRKTIEKITVNELEDYVYSRDSDARVLLLSTYTQLRGVYVYI